MQLDPVVRPTAMALAFINAAVKTPGRGRNSVRMAADRNAGLVRERPINLALSFKTVQKLKKEEVL